MAAAAAGPAGPAGKRQGPMRNLLTVLSSGRVLIFLAVVAIDETVILLTLSLHHYWYAY